jgi:hypothetical protein
MKELKRSTIMSRLTIWNARVLNYEGFVLELCIVNFDKILGPFKSLLTASLVSSILYWRHPWSLRFLYWVLETLVSLVAKQSSSSDSNNRERQV